MYFDTHAHYDDRQFDSDRDNLLASLPEAGVSLIVNHGCDLNSSETAVQLAGKYPHVYAAVGVHPHDSKGMDKSSVGRLKALSSHPKVVAIGEIGLDYHYDNSPRDIQKTRFREQMELAREVNLPVIIHERESCSDCLSIIRDFKDVPGVFHCFSGSQETALTVLRQGWYLSFTGVITYSNAKKTLDVIRWMPLDRIMVETDSPYLSPVPNRGKRNSSLNLSYIVQTIANLKGLSHAEAARLTTENGKRFFGIQ